MARGYTTEQLLKMLEAKQGNRTQRELAAEIGIAQSNLSDFLLGRRGPSPRIVEYLGLEYGFIKSESAA